MLDDHVAVVVKERLAVLPFLVDVVAGVVLAAVLAGGEEDGVVLGARAKRPGVWVVVPFLQEENAGLGAGMRLEGVAVEADDGEDACLFGNESRMYSSVVLLKRPWGRTMHIRPPGLRNSRLRSMKRMSRPCLSCHLPLSRRTSAMPLPAYCLTFSGSFSGSILTRTHFFAKVVLMQDSRVFDVARKGRDWSSARRS